MKKSTFLHLRFPFSIFLLPVYLFAVAICKDVNLIYVALCFFILHFLVYPASNGYNSYFDKDEDSIGGLENPPEVSKELYYVSLLLDLVALLLAWYISVVFMVMVFIYGLISKMYSHPSVRLKKMPYIGWVAAGVFQGYFTFIMTLVAVGPLSINDTFTAYYQFPAILSTLLLFGSYPMTQVYQHEEDARRGDMTISRVLGILGTFHFTAISFFISTIGFSLYFLRYFDVLMAILFVLFMSPLLVYFLRWYFKVRINRRMADFKHTMRLNLLSSVLLNLFFLYLWWY